ncbi:MAG TPA: hypothetical protein VII92_02620 [Anaerolineae bacterium]
MRHLSQDFGEPDGRGVVRNARGDTGIRGQNGYIFFFRNEANERYARLLAQSPFFRRPQYVSPVIDNGKLVLESSGRRVTVEPETWPGLADALLRIHFEYSPPKVKPNE